MSIRSRAGRAEHLDLVARQVALFEDAVADRVVDVVVDVGDAVDDAHDLALERLRLARAGVREDAVDDFVVRLSRCRDARRLLVVAETAVAQSSSSAASPAWPNGGWPMSCPSPIASARSSFSRSARATTRAIPVVSSVCVMRVR